MTNPEMSPCPNCGALGWVFPCSECGEDPMNRLLTYDEADALGWDATGRDGDPRFPYHLSDAWALSYAGGVLVPGCRTCDEHISGEMMPSHFASPRCESGQHPHCTCDTCF